MFQYRHFGFWGSVRVHKKTGKIQYNEERVLLHNSALSYVFGSGWKDVTEAEALKEIFNETEKEDFANLLKTLRNKEMVKEE